MWRIFAHQVRECKSSDLAMITHAYYATNGPIVVPQTANQERLARERYPYLENPFLKRKTYACVSSVSKYV